MGEAFGYKTLDLLTQQVVQMLLPYKLYVSSIVKSRTITGAQSVDGALLTDLRTVDFNEVTSRFNDKVIEVVIFTYSR